MGKPCARCAMYRLQILTLKAQIERLKQVIRRLEAIIQRVYDYAKSVLSESQPVLSKQSGVKRAVWAYHLSRCKVAVNIVRKLKGG